MDATTIDTCAVTPAEVAAAEGDGPSTAARLTMGGLFLVLGTSHFVKPEAFEAIVPARLPWKRFWVYSTGVLELGGAAGLLNRRWATRRLGWALVALLVLVFPANVNQAVSHVEIEGMPALPRWLLWARLPFQAVMIKAVLDATRPE